MSRTSTVPFILGLALLAAAVPASAQGASAKMPQLVRIVGKGEKIRATPTAQTLRRYAGKRLTMECGRPGLALKKYRVPDSVSYGMTVRAGASVPAWELYCVARVHLGGKPAEDPRQLFTPTSGADVFLDRLKAIAGLQRAYRAWQTLGRYPTADLLAARDKAFVAAAGPDASADAPHVAVWVKGPVGDRPSGGVRATTTTTLQGITYYVEQDFITNTVSSNAFDLLGQLDQKPVVSEELFAAWKPRPEPGVPARRGIGLAIGDLAGLGGR